MPGRRRATWAGPYWDVGQGSTAPVLSARVNCKAMRGFGWVQWRGGGHVCLSLWSAQWGDGYMLSCTSSL